jgi:hypothetical protein
LASRILPPETCVAIDRLWLTDRQVARDGVSAERLIAQHLLEEAGRADQMFAYSE